MAEIAAGVAGTVAAGLFKYNRGNYRFDTQLRFERYMSAREFALAQADQFRNDLRCLTGMTCQKVGQYHSIGILSLCLSMVLFGPGRLGLHGPAPPGWLMGLYLTNNAAALALFITTNWFAMHASMRAQAASTFLLTRKMRLPVPTRRQLDKVRGLSSAFEKQQWRDIFRVPFVGFHPAQRPVEADDYEITEDMVDNEGNPRRTQSAPSTPRGGTKNERVPTWQRDEWLMDKVGAVTAPATNDPEDVCGAAPQHFRQYLAIQDQWWPQEVYGRIALFYGIIHLVEALAIYSVGHVVCETRAFWASYTVPFLLCVLMFLIINFDICPGRCQEKLAYAEYAGPFVPMLMALAMSIDFRVHFSKTAIAINFVVVFIAYFLQIIYTLRLMELIIPDEARQPEPENLGHPWWPANWRIPSAFSHVLYLVAPPSELRPGQNDLQWEMRELARKGDAPSALKETVPQSQHDKVKELETQIDQLLQSWISSRDSLAENSRNTLNKQWHQFNDVKARLQDSRLSEEEMGRLEYNLRQIKGKLEELATQVRNQGGMVPPTVMSMGNATPKPMFMQMASKTPHPWKVLFLILSGVLTSWCFLVLGTTIEIFIGEQGFLQNPGTPPWSRPGIRLPRGEYWTGLGHEEYMEKIGRGKGVRRLQGDPHAMAQELLEALPHSLEGAEALLKDAVSAEALLSASAVRHTRTPASPWGQGSAAWPSFFEPRLLACSPTDAQESAIAAALTPRGYGATVRVGADGVTGKAEPFALTGLGDLGRLLGASLDPEGLLLVSHMGHLARCPGTQPPAGGSWACRQLGAAAQLPLVAGRKLLAAAAVWTPQTAAAGTIHAAFVAADEPETVALFSLAPEAASWTPSGEIPSPSGTRGARLSLAFDGPDLLISVGDGVVQRVHLASGVTTQEARFSSDQSTGNSREWQGACGARGVGVLHLALQKRAGWRTVLPQVTLQPNLQH